MSKLKDNSTKRKRALAFRLKSMRGCVMCQRSTGNRWHGVESWARGHHIYVTNNVRLKPEWSFLIEYDHLGDKVANISDMCEESKYTVQDVWAEMKKCQTLCGACHKAKTFRGPDPRMWN